MASTNSDFDVPDLPSTIVSETNATSTSSYESDLVVSNGTANVRVESAVAASSVRPRRVPMANGDSDDD